MKKFKSLFFCAAIFSLIFSSCSEEKPVSVDQEKGVLSLSAMLNDLGKNSNGKQAIADIPECSNEDAVYVEIVLSSNGGAILGSQEDPFRIDLVAGSVFTEEVPELELTPGNYSLDYFAVYDAGDNVIWVAPMGGSEMAAFVDNALPLSINIGAGVKKYVEVPVLCFENRMANQFGYLLFNVSQQEAIEWCIFGNYCDETGRHYPAAFRVDIWNYENGQRGSSLYTNLTNTVELNDAGDYAGSTICVALPDNAGEDEYYVQITLLNSDAYGDVTERVIREGVITDADVRSLFSGDTAVDYYHFREGCNNEDSPNLFEGDNEQANTYYGPSVQFGQGTAQTLVRIGSDGDLQAVGVKISEETLEGLPSDPQRVTLQFPEEAEGMIFDHFDLEWNPNGHEPPGIYDIPHFDMHFYTISEIEKMNITNPELAEVLPAPQFWPETYVPTPGFVPMMGKHWISTEAGEINGEVFDHTFIFGSYNGNFIFYEPMITLDYLRGKPNQSFNIFQPSEFERTGYHPTTYSIRYDSANDEYVILLEGMMLR